MGTKNDAEVGFIMMPVVWFDIQGKFVAPHHTRLDSKNLIGDFMRWLSDEEIWPARMQTSGGGVWTGAFFPEDAERVKVWLLEHGAVEVEQHATSKQRRKVKR